jgi:hypothetical protein
VLRNYPTLHRDRDYPMFRRICRSAAKVLGAARIHKERRATEEERLKRRRDEELALRRAAERAADDRERVDALAALRQLRAEVRLWRQRR